MVKSNVYDQVFFTSELINTRKSLLHKQTTKSEWQDTIIL